MKDSSSLSRTELAALKRLLGGSVELEHDHRGSPYRKLARRGLAKIVSTSGFVQGVWCTVTRASINVEPIASERTASRVMGGGPPGRDVVVASQKNTGYQPKVSSPNTIQS